MNIYDIQGLKGGLIDFFQAKKTQSIRHYTDIVILGYTGR